MKHLLVGSRGQLGLELLNASKECGFDCEALDIPQLDLTDRGAVEKTLGRENFSLVINAAAYTAVDRAERTRISLKSLSLISL